MTQKIFPEIINTAGSLSGQYLKNVDGTVVWADAPSMAEGEVTFADIKGNVEDNIALGNALAAKLNISATTSYTRNLLAAADAQAARTLLGLTDSVEGLDPLALTTDLIPALDGVYNLGSATHRWQDIFVSANTIYLGDGTQLSGTSIVVDGGPNADSLSDMPTIQASKIVAVPFSYDPGTGIPVHVRPSIEFQIGADAYPISLNTETFEFSLDAQGNYGTGSLVAKKVTLNNPSGIAASLVGGIAHDGSYLNTTPSNEFRFDGNVTLGYDSTKNLLVKAATTFEGGVTFKGGATLGDGNDAIALNAGVNAFTVAANNFTLDTSGNLVLQGNLTVRGATTTIQSNTLSIGDNIIVLNSDMGIEDVPTQDAGILVARGTEDQAKWLWNETLDAWGPVMGSSGLGNIAGVNTITANQFVGNLTGSASTASRLSTPRTINGVAFDGSANITVEDSTKLAASLAGAFGLSVLSTQTSAQATALLDTFTSSLKGLVPAPATSTGAFLKDDGTWAVPPSGEAFELTDGTKGEITVSQGGTVWTIDANVVTTAKFQQISTDSFLGRGADGTGNVEVLSTTSARDILNISNVNNTSDADKPLSSAAQSALNTKVDKGLVSASGLTMAPSSLVGRGEGATGPIGEITVGNGLSLTGSQLSVEFPDNGWGFTVTAVGTGVPQNIELPEADLSPLDVMVFNDGIRFYTDEYTITGSTLVMTSNYPDDKIEIVKLPTRSVLTQPIPARDVMSDGSANYTPSATAITRYVRLTNESPITVSIPDAYVIGTELVFEQAGGGMITFVGASGVTLYSRDNRIQSAGQYAVVMIKKVDAVSWVISGDVI